MGSGYLGVYVGKKHQTGYQRLYSVHSVCGLALDLKNVESPWRRAWQPTPVFLFGEDTDRAIGRGAWRATVHEVTESQTELSD